MSHVHKISPHLWFDTQAEEAALLYTTVFPNSSVTRIARYPEAISFMVHCDDQAEIDHYWEKLGEGGDPQAHQCGWLKDKFGVSWQIAPKALTSMLMDPNPQRAASVMRAMLQMKKLDIAALERAAAA